MKFNYLKVLSIAVLTFGLAACGTTPKSDTSSSTGSNSSSEDTGAASQNTSFTITSDVSVDTDISSSEYKALEGDIKISLADGASTTDNISGYVSIDNSTNRITISNANNGFSYIISGTLSNGSIVITSTVKDVTCELVLNGVSITSSDQAPISSTGKAKLKIKNADGSLNYIEDNRPVATDVDESAAILSNKKLSVVGQGSLSIAANYKNGIGSDKGLEVKNGSLTIVATNNGMKCHEKVQIGEDTDFESDSTVINIDAKNQGVRSEHSSSYDATSDDPSEIVISCGYMKVIAAYDGVQADDTTTINGGEVDIKTGGGSSYSVSSSDTNSYKGLKADTTVTISGGKVQIDSRDDAIHSNKDVNISGGVLSLYSGDDGVHADNELNVSGGTTSILKAYEGYEGVFVNISGETSYIYTSDDGMNAAGGSDSSGGGSWGQQSSTGTLTISGGYNYVNSLGDGLDSNGSIYITGGFSVVGETGNGNGPLDYGDHTGDVFEQSGGFLAAYGSSGMAVNVTGGSQASYFIKHSSVVSTSSYYIVDIGGSTMYVIKPKVLSYSLYVSSGSFSSSLSGTLYNASSILGGTELFRGVYELSSYSGSTSLGTWSWSSSNLHPATGGSSSGQPGGPGH